MNRVLSCTIDITLTGILLLDTYFAMDMFPLVSGGGRVLLSCSSTHLLSCSPSIV